MGNTQKPMDNPERNRVKRSGQQRCSQKRLPWLTAETGNSLHITGPSGHPEPTSLNGPAYTSVGPEKEDNYEGYMVVNWAQIIIKINQQKQRLVAISK